MSDIADRVKKVIVNQLSIEESKVLEDSNFVDDLGADSLDMAELVIAFEEEFGCEISDSVAESIKTVQDAVSFLNSPKEVQSKQ